MRLVALLAMRNEIRYIDSVLAHLVHEGAEVCVIDNGSTDGSREIAEGWLGHGVVRIVDQPWTGAFELTTQLRLKEQIAQEEVADWYLHLDADERRFAPPPYATLVDGLTDVEARGYNAVDFDEFVFLPTVEDPSFEDCDFSTAMRWYYHYEPESPDRLRINAWQRQGQVDLVSSAGHHVQFSDQRVFPRPFVMRHYPILSEAHAREKYENRDFAPDELARKWHSDRAAFKADGVRLPSRAQLHEVEPDMAPDPTEPWDRHPFLDLAAGPAPTRVAVDPDRPARLRALVDYATRHRAHVVEIPPATGDGPRWSVMLPVRDPRPAHLTAALRSVLDQDPGGNRMDIEVIDDASAATDVASIVSSVGGDRVRYHRNPSRLGLAGNWNAAVTRARGQFVHLLHQDDRVVPGFYDRLGRALAADPSLVAAYCRVAGIDNDGRLTWVQPPERLEAGVMTDLAVKEAEAHRVLTAGVTVRRSTYEAIGGYRDDLPYCTDWDFLKRAAVLGPIWYEPLVLAHWRQHDDQETVRLQATGEDLVDRRRSIELTATLLPRELRPRVEARALDASIVAALERLRELVEADEIEAAIAQTREVLFTLETRRAEIPNRARNEWVPNLDGLGAQRQADADQRRIAELEAQLKGWVAAVRMARTHSADGER